MSQIATSCKSGQPELWGGGPSCQSGPFCKSSKAITGLGGPIGAATPFVDGTDLFQRICYSPPYITETAGALDCVQTFATMAGCRWDAECPATHACVRAECKPREELARVTAGNSISAINPQAIGWFARDDARAAEFIPAPYNANAQSARNYLEKMCPSSTGVLVTDCKTQNCGTQLVCPYYNGNQGNDRNCANCIRNLYKCDYFRDQMSEREYRDCKRKENVFQYDVATPNGAIHPLSYKMNPEDLPTVREALYQCAASCAIETQLAM